MVYVNGERYDFLSISEEEKVRELNRGIIRVHNQSLYKDEHYVRVKDRSCKNYNFISDKSYVKPKIEIRAKGFTIVPLNIEIVKINKMYIEKYDMKIPYYVLTIKIKELVLKSERNDKAILDFIVTYKGGKFIVR